MSDKPNGGSAFPTADFTHAGQIIPGSEGMSLRDWFAGLAMQGMLACTVKSSASMYASDAYTIANAMLKEREK